MRRQAQARGPGGRSEPAHTLPEPCTCDAHITCFSVVPCNKVLLILQAASIGQPISFALCKVYHNVAKYIGAFPADSAQLRRVALTLPPPARLDFRTGTELPRTTHLALEKLLNACGVSYEFSGAWQVPLPSSSLKQLSVSRTVFVLQCFAAGHLDCLLPLITTEIAYVKN